MQSETDIPLRYIALVPIVVVGFVVGAAAYHQVPEGHVGVETELGAVTGSLDQPGPNWKTPWIEGIQNVEVRPRTYTMSDTKGEGQKKGPDAITVKTVNGSTVGVDVTIRYRIDESEAHSFVRDWNNERQMERRLIRPTIRDEMRDEASDIQTTGPEGIYTRHGREALAKTARKALLEEFEDEPIVLEAVQIRNIDLPQGIDRTLDRKEQAKQQVEVEREKVKQARQQAEQRRVEAQADADVIRTKGAALRENPIVLQERLIDAYDRGTVFVTSGDQPIILGESAVSGGGATNATSTVPLPGPGGT